MPRRRASKAIEAGASLPESRHKVPGVRQPVECGAQRLEFGMTPTEQGNCRSRSGGYPCSTSNASSVQSISRMRHALAHAVTIGHWYGSHITALHVGNPMIVLTATPPVLFAEAPDGGFTAKTSRQELEDHVGEWLAPARSAGLQTEIIIDEGNPAACVLEHAASLPANLIVMGTHGRGGFERLALGSVAEKVLRKAKCPVIDRSATGRRDVQAPVRAPALPRGFFRFVDCRPPVRVLAGPGVERAPHAPARLRVAI